MMMPLMQTEDVLETLPVLPITITEAAVIIRAPHRVRIQIPLLPQLQPPGNARFVWVKAIPPVPIVTEAASARMLRLDSAAGCLAAIPESMTTVVSTRESVLRVVDPELKRVPVAVVSEQSVTKGMRLNHNLHKNWRHESKITHGASFLSIPSAIPGIYYLFHL